MTNPRLSVEEILSQVQELLNKHWKTTLPKRVNARLVAPLIAELLQPQKVTSNEASILARAVSEVAERCWQQLGTDASIRIQGELLPLFEKRTALNQQKGE